MQRPHPPDELSTSAARISEHLQSADWAGAQPEIEQLVRSRFPATEEGLRGHLEDLGRLLDLARNARANLAASLVRVRAAAGFNRF